MLLSFDPVSCFPGHNRYLHCLTFNPVTPYELIAATQDGKIRLLVSHLILTTIVIIIQLVGDGGFVSQCFRESQQHKPTSRTTDRHRCIVETLDRSPGIHYRHHLSHCVCSFNAQDTRGDQQQTVGTSSASIIRDVAYSPARPTMFASAHENGAVGLWDTRHMDRPLRTYQAHPCLIASLDWLPTWEGIK